MKIDVRMLVYYIAILILALLLAYTLIKGI